MTDDTRPILFTLCEGDYHHGVAALINSAHNSGFSGRCVVAYRGPMPAWAESLETSDGIFKVGEVDVDFVASDPPMHFGYFKPFFACELLDKYPKASALIYADPDVLFLAPWQFFRNWILENQSIGLCADQNFPIVSAQHPWRKDWKSLIQLTGIPVASDSAPYINSGLVGVHVANASLWKTWCDITLAYQQQGGDLLRFRMSERWRSVVSDQDLLAASLMTLADPPSLLGQEGMGFNGDFNFVCHVVEQPKPWRFGKLRRAIKGSGPSTALRMWKRHSSGPIVTINRYIRFLHRLDLMAAIIVSRFYRRT